MYTMKHILKQHVLNFKLSNGFHFVNRNITKPEQYLLHKIA
jgi:hypothetical protein